ncbi:hypothetical protein PR202_gb13148 [Eleusine coracana subsp. coracana]|uniref:Uncharacterized protein n=1 Tax=Eleusine coracana subsp. coracana TaxID=191504 RepID=A0AAV5ES96_ELECO|nr:hypothetical protein PR202_gb13148 [Eleusine coracana subsp. coracana]
MTASDGQRRVRDGGENRGDIRQSQAHRGGHGKHQDLAGKHHLREGRDDTGSDGGGEGQRAWSMSWRSSTAGGNGGSKSGGKTAAPAGKMGQG